MSSTETWPTTDCHECFGEGRLEWNGCEVLCESCGGDGKEDVIPCAACKRRPVDLENLEAKRDELCRECFDRYEREDAEKARISALRPLCGCTACSGRVVHRVLKREVG